MEKVEVVVAEDESSVRSVSSSGSSTSGRGKSEGSTQVLSGARKLG